MTFASSIYVLFITLMHLVSRVQFLNTISLSLLLGFTAGGGTGAVLIAH